MAQSLRQRGAAPNHEQPLHLGEAGRPLVAGHRVTMKVGNSPFRWETALSAPAPVEGRPPPFPSVPACVPAGGLQDRVVRCSAGKSGCERRPGSRALPDVIISALKWLFTVGTMGCYGRKTTIADPSTLDHSPPETGLVESQGGVGADG